MCPAFSQEKNMEEQKRYDDEIDLNTYLKAIIKKKNFIITVFLLAVIVTTAFSLFTPRTYRATALILITPAKIDKYLDALKASQVFPNDSKAETSANNPTPAIALPTHKMLLTSNAVLTRVINKLDLKDKQGHSLHAEDLLNSLQIKEEEQTNIFELSALDKDPELAMKIVNAWAGEYIQYSLEIISGEIKGTSDFVVDQFVTAKKNLYDSEQKLADFKDHYKIDLMQAELDLKKNALNSYKKDYLTLETTIKLQEDLLKELKTQIGNQSPFIVTSKAITNEALWQASVQGKNLDDFDHMKLKSESVNPIYQDLKSRIINIQTELVTNLSKGGYLREEIISTQRDINDLEKMLDKKEIEFHQLNREIKMYKKTYESLSDKIEEARMAKASQLGEVKLVSPAILPERPMSRNTVKNALLAGIAALFLGSFLVFAKEVLIKG